MSLPDHCHELSQCPATPTHPQCPASQWTGAVQSVPLSTVSVRELKSVVSVRQRSFGKFMGKKKREKFILAAIFKSHVYVFPLYIFFINF